MTFLNEPSPSDGQRRLYEDDLGKDGFVWDLTRVWGHQPDLFDPFAKLIGAAANAAGLSLREKAMLVLGQAATIGDSYCSLAWSRWLSEAEHADIALAVLRHDDQPLTERERALADWARALASAPNDTDAADVQRLRDVGFDDAQIVALTLFGALRLALSTANDALGARPDLALAEMLSPEIRDTVTWGRAPA